MRWISLILTWLTFAFPGLSTPVIYVTNSSSNTVSVVDVGRNRVIKEIPVGTEPFGLVFSPDGKRAYVASAKSQEVCVIDTSRHRLINRIPLKTKLPVWIAVSPDGSYLYVTNESSHEVAVIAAANNTLLSRIPVGQGPAGIVISPDSRYAYVANEGSQDVSVIDLQREEVIHTVPVGPVPQAITMSPDGAWVYVANFGNDSVSVVETASHQVVAQISVEPTTSSTVEQGPVGIALSPDGQWIYTGNFKAGTLSIINASAQKAVATIPIGAETFGVATDPSGRRLYIVNGRDRQISIIEPNLLKVTGRIKVGEGPFSLAVMPEHKTGFELNQLWILICWLGPAVLAIWVIQFPLLSNRQKHGLLGSIFFLALVLRLVGLNWGIPTFDADTARAVPEMRVSYHLDEDNFLWSLTRVRPKAFDFYVPDFHWGTLQFHLIEIALLAAQSLGVVSTPWRESFLSFNPKEYARLFMVGRAVSVLLGSCSIFLAYSIAKKLYGEQTGMWAAFTLALLPLHVINCHYLTPDINMVFFLLLAFYGVLSTFEQSNHAIYCCAGMAFGLAISAKYNAAFLLPTLLVSSFLQKEIAWSKKAWLYIGTGVGFALGEPYALLFPKEFWQTLQKYFLNTFSLPQGAVPPLYKLLGLQLKNVALFGFGLPLVLGSILMGFKFLVSKAGKPRPSARSAPCSMPNPQLATRCRILLWVSILCSSISVLVIRQPMLRYTLPVVVFLVIPLSHILYLLSFQKWGKALVYCLTVCTAIYTCSHLYLLTQEHTVNQAFQWIERHVPPGASLTKGWPEIPVLNSQKYRIQNSYTQNRMVGFEEFFTRDNGQTSFSDYVLLDNLATFDIPPQFLQELNQYYCLVAKFKRDPQFWGFSLPEWNPPHDWKYSHPEIRIYRRRRHERLL